MLSEKSFSHRLTSDPGRNMATNVVPESEAKMNIAAEETNNDKKAIQLMTMASCVHASDSKLQLTDSTVSEFGDVGFDVNSDGKETEEREREERVNPPRQPPSPDSIKTKKKKKRGKSNSRQLSASKMNMESSLKLSQQIQQLKKERKAFKEEILYLKQRIQHLEHRLEYGSKSTDPRKEKLLSGPAGQTDDREETTFLEDLWKLVESVRTFISSLLEYLLLWSIISEIFLLSEVYAKGDIKFFCLSLAFLVLPPLVLSLFIYVYWIKDKHRQYLGRFYYLLFIPVINVIFFKSAFTIKNDSNGRFKVAIIDSFLMGTMTFPLYVINLSYLLESVTSFNDGSLFNYAQICISVLNFVRNPIILVQQVTLYNQKPFRCVHWASSSLCFIPLVTVEIIHFFPFLFAYYMGDGAMDFNDLVNIMLIFNVPKLLFIGQLLTLGYQIDWFGGDCSCKHCCKRVLEALLQLPALIIVPLVPSVFFMDSSEFMSKKKGIWKFHCLILLAYVWISYGGSCIYMINVVGMGAISDPVTMSIITLLALLVFITVTFPIAYMWMKKEGVVIAQWF